MTTYIRILFVADSHLGFDLPERPRVDRRRRGHDFLANHEAALATALDEEVDMVVHGGDVFDRPDVPASLAYQAYAPMLRIAERGVPVFVVPGNHERSRLPHIRLARHDNVHVFDRPRTFAVRVRGVTVALSGFPYEWRDVRTGFPALLEQTGWRASNGDRPAARLLCVHHCVEGATVGPGDFKFTTASDVIRARDAPADFAAVLSGHIHRRQMLVNDLRGRPLDVPVLYPGSVERTSLAEIGEPKGFMMLRLDARAGRVEWEYRDLPARPMIVEEIDAHPPHGSLESRIRAIIDTAPPDAVLRIRVRGALRERDLRAVSAARIRGIAPATMNVEVDADAPFRRGPAQRRDRASNRNPRGTATAAAPDSRGAPIEPIQLEL